MTPAKHADQNPWNSLRWKGITRHYTRADIDRLKGSVQVEYTLARTGSEKFWQLLKNEPFVPALGALNGNQAVEMAQAGLPAVYIEDCPLNGGIAATYGVASNPAHSVSQSVRAVNHAFLRADQVSHSRRENRRDWMLPIVAQGDTGSRGPLAAFESTRDLIESGAAAVHFSDEAPVQNGRKILIPLEEMIQKLTAARMAADTMGVATVIIARTDAESATYITSDHDSRDHRFLTGERAADGKYMYRGGLQAAIDRALALAPYADLLWCEFRDLNKEIARNFADAIHAKFPRKLLSYNCSPSFHWRAKMNEEDLGCFQHDLATMGYRFQFISLAGYHMLNLSMYQFAQDYLASGMTAYSQLQELELLTAKQLGLRPTRNRESVVGRYSAAISSVLTGSPNPEHNSHFPGNLEPCGLDMLYYNDDEATVRTPLPQLYPSLEPEPQPMAAAAD